MANVDAVNPPELIPPHGYSHVVRVTGGTTLYLAGQSAFNAAGALVGDDHETQTREAFRNTLTALAAAGATWADVVKATYYVVNTNPESLAAFQRAMNEVIGNNTTKVPAAATFVGVQSLAFAPMLVEIDVIAVID